MKAKYVAIGKEPPGFYWDEQYHQWLTRGFGWVTKEHWAKIQAYEAPNPIFEEVFVAGDPRIEEGIRLNPRS